MAGVGAESETEWAFGVRRGGSTMSQSSMKKAAGGPVGPGLCRGHQFRNWV